MHDILYVIFKLQNLHLKEEISPPTRIANSIQNSSNGPLHVNFGQEVPNIPMCMNLMSHTSYLPSNQVFWHVRVKVSSSGRVEKINSAHFDCYNLIK
jgi:hypothetical protein